MGLNPMGFRSRIYQLTKAGDGPTALEHQVADLAHARVLGKSALSGRLHSQGAHQSDHLTPREQVIDLVGGARAEYAAAIDSGANGAAPERVADRLVNVRERLFAASRQGVAGFDYVGGAPSTSTLKFGGTGAEPLSMPGGVGALTNSIHAADEVIRALRSGTGITAAGIDDPVHHRIWELRHQLDLVWNEIGAAPMHVAGGSSIEAPVARAAAGALDRSQHGAGSSAKGVRPAGYDDDVERAAADARRAAAATPVLGVRDGLTVQGAMHGDAPRRWPAR